MVKTQLCRVGFPEAERTGEEEGGARLWGADRGHPHRQQSRPNAQCVCKVSLFFPDRNRTEVLLTQTQRNHFSSRHSIHVTIHVTTCSAKRPQSRARTPAPGSQSVRGPEQRLPRVAYAGAGGHHPPHGFPPSPQRGLAEDGTFAEGTAAEQLLRKKERKRKKTCRSLGHNWFVTWLSAVPPDPQHGGFSGPAVAATDMQHVGTSPEQKG